MFVKIYVMTKNFLPLKCGTFVVTVGWKKTLYGYIDAIVYYYYYYFPLFSLFTSDFLFLGGANRCRLLGREEGLRERLALWAIHLEKKNITSIQNLAALLLP